MATFTLAKLISDWELLNTALQPHLTDMPFLKDKAAELEALIAEAKGMDSKQQELRGSLQETVRQRGDLEKRGKTLKSRLAAMLRGSLGFDNQTLLGFGVKPRRPRKKKAPAGTPQPEPQPAAQQ
jgi:chromosome segregation ATPase